MSVCSYLCLEAKTPGRWQAARAAVLNRRLTYALQSRPSFDLSLGVSVFFYVSLCPLGCHFHRPDLRETETDQVVAVQPLNQRCG